LALSGREGSATAALTRGDVADRLRMSPPASWRFATLPAIDKRELEADG